jgi:microcin C transport system substrate-binding protein
MNSFLKTIGFCCLALVLLPMAGRGEPSHGMALYGPQDLKYKDWSKQGHFDCVNPDAPKGGELRIGFPGGLTKLNPYSLKGYYLPYPSILIFETLMTGSPDPDEPFSMYGLLAEKAEIAADRLSITYWLNPKAHWSDGKPVTADDVIFTFAAFQDPGCIPYYRNYYSEVERLEKLDDRTVRFILKNASNQELPLITGQMPVLPRHIYGVAGKNFGDDFQNVLVGSGPYKLKAFSPDFSEHITLERDPNWWGKDLPVNRGCYNFDTIIFRLYQDSGRIKDDIKSMNPASQLDVMLVYSSGEWAKEFDNQLVQNNWLVKKPFPHQRVPYIQGFFLNLRKPIFKDIRIRKVIGSAIDFEKMNRDLFYRLYIRQISYWDNNPEIMSRGPAQGKVADLLVALNKKYGDAAVPRDAWERGPYNMDTAVDSRQMSISDRIAAASIYLDSIGWKYDRRRGVRVKNDQELAFEILVDESGWLRIIDGFAENLRKMGIRCSQRVVQPAEIERKIREFDFDMLISNIRTSESPGNELFDYFHSRNAMSPGSSNLSGIQNPAVDEILTQIIRSRNRIDLVAAVKALDRILCANHYLILQWYLNYDRMIYWNRLGYPEQQSWRIDYPYNVLTYWWADADKAAKLKSAMEKKRKLE